MPMAGRMDNLKVPVSFWYGDKDWMSPEGGIEACRRMKEGGNKEKVETVIVARAGHHVYLDNPEKVNELLMEELSGVRP